MDRWQYLIVLAACLAITLPLEIFRPRRLPPGVAGDARGVTGCRRVSCSGTRWRSPHTCGPTTRAYITGVTIPFQMPIEEVLFFLVIPLCALLTYNAVSAILERFNRR